jgi:hypothetical protein
MAQTDELLGIDSARHKELAGRHRYIWWRRVALVVIAVLPILGLVNVFGQRTHIDTSSAAGTTLEVKSPTRVRGGLTFSTEIVITSNHDLQDAVLYLERGWFANMTFNGSSPQPSSEIAQGVWQIWDYGQIQANQPFRIWISWQTNPTNVGGHSQAVELYDGTTKLTSTQHYLTVFP